MRHPDEYCRHCGGSVYRSYDTDTMRGWDFYDVECENGCELGENDVLPHPPDVTELSMEGWDVWESDV